MFLKIMIETVMGEAAEVFNTAHKKLNVTLAIPSLRLKNKYIINIRTFRKNLMSPLFLIFSPEK